MEAGRILAQRFGDELEQLASAWLQRLVERLVKAVRKAVEVSRARERELWP